MASVAATLVETEEAGSLVFAAAGDWLVATAAKTNDPASSVSTNVAATDAMAPGLQ